MNKKAPSINEKASIQNNAKLVFIVKKIALEFLIFIKYILKIEVNILFND